MSTFRIRLRAVALVAWSVAMMVVSALAGPPIGTVTSAGPLDLSGARVSTQALASLPIGDGDVVATTTMPAVILLRGMSRVFLDIGSSVRLRRDGGTLSLEILSGLVSYKLMPEAAINVVANSAPLAPELQTAGTVTVKGTAVQARPFSPVLARTGPSPGPEPRPRSKDKDDGNWDTRN